MTRSNLYRTAAVCLIISAAFVATAVAGIPAPHKEPNMVLVQKNLIESLRSDNDGVRLSAVQMIAQYNITGLNDRLITILREDANIKVRMAAAYAVMMFGTDAGKNAVRDIAFNASVSDKQIAQFCETLLLASGQGNIVTQ